jgi:hypothetical protein
MATGEETSERRARGPHVTPAEVAALFAGGLPTEGEPSEAPIEDWRDQVAPYLGAGPRGGAGLESFEYGPQMSRALRALKVWMVLQARGGDRGAVEGSPLARP